MYVPAVTFRSIVFKVMLLYAKACMMLYMLLLKCFICRIKQSFYCYCIYNLVTLIEYRILLFLRAENKVSILF